jgi:uncharacterized protein YdhG (YjbR/CyaY superfamily)
MSAEEIDDYLAALEEVPRSTLNALRATIRSVVPDAEEGLGYGAPVFRLNGTAVAGFAAYARHLSYLPHSGTVLATMGSEVDGYACSKGALKFALDTPLPEPLVRSLIQARIAEISPEER